MMDSMAAGAPPPLRPATYSEYLVAAGLDGPCQGYPVVTLLQSKIE